MKKLSLAIIITLAITASAFAQEAPAPQPAPAKQPTMEELQWQAMYLNEHLKALQGEYNTTQTQLRDIQAKLKAMQPPTISAPQQAPKEAPATKQEPKKK